MADQIRHVLLVEDEAALREAVAEQLTDRGYHVEQADSGEMAIDKLADFAFDIILTDLRLPGIDGSAVVDRKSTRSSGDSFIAPLAISSSTLNPPADIRRSAS